jgi:hypothetical protein
MGWSDLFFSRIQNLLNLALARNGNAVTSIISRVLKKKGTAGIFFSLSFLLFNRVDMISTRICVVIYFCRVI